PSDAQLANQILLEESRCHFPSFTASDAITLGLSLRKRFRGSSRHAKGGHGLVLTIQTIAGHTLFSCTVGDLADTPDVSLESWAALEGIVDVVRKTAHASYYGTYSAISALGKAPKQMGFPDDKIGRLAGGGYPIWLSNAPCCPIAIVACYSGSSLEDHLLVSTTVRDYLAKIAGGGAVPAPPPRMP
ncbi:hypothetical protein FISHEDRAFT_6625, partial [Fistulina hepatica ATCC 64428]